MRRPPPKQQPMTNLLLKVIKSGNSNWKGWQAIVATMEGWFPYL